MSGTDIQSNTQLSEVILIRRKDIVAGINAVLKGTSAEIFEEESSVFVELQGAKIFGIEIFEKYYKIFGFCSEWMEVTTCHCEIENDIMFYYVDTSDEVVGEIKRLVMHEATKEKNVSKKADELRSLITYEIFKEAYSKFIDQADKNAITGNAQGSRTPYGFPVNHLYGYRLQQQFGQGRATKTPYLYWHVVSIYYLPETGKIIIGIEENRYIHLKEMEYKKLITIGNKAKRVAVFYESNKDVIDYKALYDNFIRASDEVVNLGID